MTIVQEPGVSALAFVPAPTVRRRRVVVGLAGVVAAAAVAAVGTGSAAAWSLLGAGLVLAGGYAALFHRSRRLAMERGFRHLRVSDRAWSLDQLGDLAVPTPEPVTGPMAGRVVTTAVPAWRQVLGLARFVASCAAGWALSPLVFALTVAVGKTPRDTTGQRWLANLQATQLQLKEQSRRTLVVSAAATASVTGVAGATVLSGPGVAAAAAPASAPTFPGAAPQLSASAPAVGGTYVVVRGDTLSSIAARFGTTYQSLATANHLADPNRIFPGQVLAIHGSVAPGASSRSSSSTYRVVAGDSLSSIAARFGTTYQNLAALNGIANANLIEVGQVLRVSGSAPPSRSSTVTATPAVTRSGAGGSGARASGAAASGRGQVAAQTARAQVGKPYVWAGAGPSGFDCSGLAMYAWAAAGVQLAHYTVTQYQETERIAESQLQPGDLVFYDTGGGAQPGHVTIYIGGGQIVTADSPGTVVRVEALDWDGVPMGFGRVG